MFNRANLKPVLGNRISIDRMKSSRRRFLRGVGSGVFVQSSVGVVTAGRVDSNVTVTGKVVNHQGDPAAYRKVHAANQSGSGYIDTDSNGVFQKSVPENSTLYLGFYKWGDGQLHAPEMNHVPHMDGLGRFDIGTSYTDLGTIHLPKAYKVDLRAVDSDGNPVTDVQFGVGADGYGSSDQLLTTTSQGYLRIRNADFTGIEIGQIGKFVFHMEDRYAKEVFIDQPTTVTAEVGGEITVEKHSKSPTAAATPSPTSTKTRTQTKAISPTSTPTPSAPATQSPAPSPPSTQSPTELGTKHTPTNTVDRDEVTSTPIATTSGRSRGFFSNNASTNELGLLSDPFFLTTGGFVLSVVGIVYNLVSRG